MEYAIVIVIILAVFIAMQNYASAGYRANGSKPCDDFGDQV